MGELVTFLSKQEYIDALAFLKNEIRPATMLKIKNCIDEYLNKYNLKYKDMCVDEYFESCEVTLNFNSLDKYDIHKHLDNIKEKLKNEVTMGKKITIYNMGDEFYRFCFIFV